jgi:DNA replication protein DnaC
MISDQTNGQGVCPICFGTGMEVVPGKGAKTCKCRIASSLDRLLAGARIPSRYAHCTLDSFKPPAGNESVRWAHEIAKSFVRDFPAVSGGLLFIGNAGVGKTHLAVGILKELIRYHGRPCLFYECGALLKEIQDSYSEVANTSELRLLAPVYEAEVLVLDELGTVMPTGWVFDTLYQIINTRYNNQKLTIFTTNYSDKPRIEKKEDESTPVRSFAQKRSMTVIEDLYTLEERISVRVRSRLHEMCTKIEMKGADYRRHMGRPHFEIRTS